MEGCTLSILRMSIFRRYVAFLYSWCRNPNPLIYTQVALYTQDYAFTSAEPREKDAFGLDTGGKMMLVPADRFRELVGNLCEAYTIPP